MSQINHDDCWVSASDPPHTERQVIIWTKKPWCPKNSTVISRHLDTDGAWYSSRDTTWHHSDGNIATDVTHWMEMPQKPRLAQRRKDQES